MVGTPSGNDVLGMGVVMCKKRVAKQERARWEHGSGAGPNFLRFHRWWHGPRPGAAHRVLHRQAPTPMNQVKSICYCVDNKCQLPWHGRACCINVWLRAIYLNKVSRKPEIYRTPACCFAQVKFQFSFSIVCFDATYEQEDISSILKKSRITFLFYIIYDRHLSMVNLHIQRYCHKDSFLCVGSQNWQIPRPTGLTDRANRSDRSRPV